MKINILKMKKLSFLLFIFFSIFSFAQKSPPAVAMPKENQENSLKVTHFAYPFKLLSDEVSKKGFEDKEWKKSIVKQFGFNEETLNRKSSNSNNKKIYQEIICSLTVKNGE